MEETITPEKNRRRKKIIITNSLFVLVGYILAQLASVLARLAGQSTMTYGQMFLCLAISGGAVLIYIALVFFKKNISKNNANVLYLIQFAIYLILYLVWIIFLNEARMVGLFFAILALCFLLANSTLVWSLTISITVFALHLTGAYIAITFLNQSGSFKKEFFYASCFLPPAIFIAYMSEMFFRQKRDIIGSKISAEKSRDALQDVITDIAEKCETLNTAAEDLLNLSTQMSSATTVIAEKSANVTSASGDMSSKISSIASSINEASDSVNLIATSAEGMTASLSAISVNSDKAKNISNRAVSQSQTASEKVKKLGGSAQEIGKITEVISEISEQTNLLALNATIEAARAGDSGKGFTVVATEIKELARQTAVATLQIKKQIEDIRGSISDTAGEILQVINIINEINEIVETIAASIEEQSVTTTEIAENVVHTSKGISTVNENAVQSSDVANKIANAISEVSTEVSEISENSSRVNQSAAGLLNLANALRALTGKFMEQ